MEGFFKEIIETIKKQKISKNRLNNVKIKLSKQHQMKVIPTDIQILMHASKADLPKIKKYLQTKPTRTISGVAVCAIMTKPFKCPHGKCIYCPGGIKSYFGTVPQSYTGKEPATLRAMRNNYDPYLQVFNRLEQYIVLGHFPGKIELIIMGGTFPSFPKKYQENFIKYAFKAMNDFSDLFFEKNKEFNILKFKDFFELPAEVKDKERTKRIQKKLSVMKNKIKSIALEKEQKRNENSNIKCVGLTMETRPDYGRLKQGNEMLRLGATRVELGVQTVYDDVLKKIERGHTIKDAIESTRILKDLGFKINYHVMPGLPGVSYKKDLEALKELFENQDFRPDMLKIYPCMVLKGTKLYGMYKKKEYKPLTTEKAAHLIAEFKKCVPSYARIMRIQRDIPTYATEAGVDKTNLRQYVEKIMKDKKIKCNCIRCREAGNYLKGKNIKKIMKSIEIKSIYYEASKGTEFFISAEDFKNKILFGFCRLRFPSQFLRKEITEDSALIRELHVYGEAAAIGKKGAIQHRGLGKELLKTAEEIAKTYYKNRIVVISGIGARNYYRRLGYKKEGLYMVKNL
ncbi:MAG: tRNA uridine(34) 5-carboxymethylaminomethyl modification radical SAM/GNAT enzyme Elp3 [Candidatus Woesearchaeota archaeon]|nr:tRNA uridine(34) 5-carboxymethylaminomethyl modification radical SAM/GNAT enzyme Elp3 [Candidatus Woesearchaeota archaeon]